MIFSNKLLILLSFTSLLIFSSCNGIKDIEYKGVKETKLQSLGLSKGTVRVVLQYHNPNKFGIDLKETQLEVYANDQYIGIAENPENNKVPRQADFDFPILVHFNPLKAFGLVGLLKSNKIKLRVKGTTKAGKGGVFIRIPIDVTENVSMQ